MNRLPILKALSLATSLSYTGVASAEQLTLAIAGVNSNEGKIYIQVFKGEKSYRADKPIAATIIPALVGDVTVHFNGLEHGEYIVRYFHDEDDDGELAKNLMGMPTEGYGFSNGAKPRFGPVKYEAAKFELNESVTTNHRTIIY